MFFGLTISPTLRAKWIVMHFTIWGSTNYKVWLFFPKRWRRRWFRMSRRSTWCSRFSLSSGSLSQSKLISQNIFLTNIRRLTNPYLQLAATTVNVGMAPNWNWFLTSEFKQVSYLGVENISARPPLFQTNRIFHSRLNWSCRLRDTLFNQMSFTFRS